MSLGRSRSILGFGVGMRTKVRRLHPLGSHLHPPPPGIASRPLQMLPFAFTRNLSDSKAGFMHVLSRKTSVSTYSAATATTQLNTTGSVPLLSSRTDDGTAYNDIRNVKRMVHCSYAGWPYYGVKKLLAPSVQSELAKQCYAADNKKITFHKAKRLVIKMYFSLFNFMSFLVVNLIILSFILQPSFANQCTTRCKLHRAYMLYLEFRLINKL